MPSVTMSEWIRKKMTKKPFTIPVEQADRQRRENRQSIGQAVIHVQHRDRHRAQRQHTRDGQVVVAGRQRNQQPERGDHEHSLRSEDRREVGPAQKGLRPQRTENRDGDRPGDDQTEALDLVDDALSIRVRRRAPSERPMRLAYDSMHSLHEIVSAAR